MPQEKQCGMLILYLKLPTDSGALEWIFFIWASDASEFHEEIAYEMDYSCKSANGKKWGQMIYLFFILLKS